MIDKNTIRPSTLFGLLLLIVAVAAGVIWIGVLLDPDSQGFDAPGLTVLALTLGCGVLSLLFFARIRWVRLTTSILLHLLIVALAVSLYAAASEEGIGVEFFIAALFLLGAGLCVIGILALHSRAMKSDFAPAPESPEDAARRGTRNRRVAVTLLSLLLLALTYIARRIVPLLIANPTISVDYVAEYNRLTRPPNYDPNRNAASHYQRFFARLPELPQVLLATGRWKTWPGNLTATEYRALEQWVADSESALPDLQQAVHCPYWWTEFQSADGSLEGLLESAHLAEQRRCGFVLTALAQYYAHRGDPKRSFEILADLYTVGVHGIQKAVLLDQLAGLGIAERTCQTALSVLAKAEVDGKVLDQARRIFGSLIAQVTAPRFTQGEWVFTLDGIQRVFTDDGSGDGRLIPKRLHKLVTDTLLYPPLSYAGAVRICLSHPSRQETIEAGRRLHETAEALTQRSPWQVFSEGSTYDDELATAVGDNYFFAIDSPVLAKLVTIGWRGKVTAEALVTVLAVLTYEAQQGHWPQSLAELVAEGLLDHVPMDPYSDGPLVYRVTDGAFTLYSVGEDFSDNSGEPGNWDEFGTDRVFWPVQ